MRDDTADGATPPPAPTASTGKAVGMKTVKQFFADMDWQGPASCQTDTKNLPIHWVVIHSTVSPCQPGQRFNVARFFRDRPKDPQTGGSANYITDPGGMCQTVKDGMMAWGAPPNLHSVHIEQSEYPSATNIKRWTNRNHVRELKQTALLTAYLCKKHGVPIRKLTVQERRDNKPGILGHKDVTDAFHQSTHWDPGAYPWRRFIRLVQSYYNQIPD